MDQSVLASCLLLMLLATKLQPPGNTVGRSVQRGNNTSDCITFVVIAETAARVSATL